MLKLDLNLLWTVVDVLILYVLLRKFCLLYTSPSPRDS